MESFAKLGINGPVLRAVKEAGFTEPSEIQRKTIPFVLDRKDVIAGSATGSGKTLAFGVGIIQHSEHGRGIQSIILTPTRELAEQVSAALRSFSHYTPLEIVAVYGGVSINPQIDALRTADVVVGTPGRLLDHIERRTIRLTDVSILVLDEADRMLDMGFIDDVERIIRECPAKRQTLLFSATITFDVDRLSKKYMTRPVKVSTGAHVDPSKLKQVYYDVFDNQKFSLLLHLLKRENASLAMVFCNSRRGTDFVADNLKKNGIEAIAIHGGLTQDKRNRVMEEFRSQKIRVLVCTDVAARGLDIQGVSHVYNYDIPNESKQYIHRIGRTARAGEEGKAVNLLSPRDFENFTAVLHDNNLNIEKIQTPRFPRARVHSAGHTGPRRPGFGRRPGRASGPRHTGRHPKRPYR